MSRRSTTIRILAALWLVAFVAGLIGVGLRLASGEELAGYGSYIPWGLWVALYAYLGGLSAGAFLLFAAGEIFRIERLRALGPQTLVVALASLLGGLLVVGLDLGRIERSWEVLVYANPRSLMAWEISFYTAYLVLVVAAVWFALRSTLAAHAKGSGLAGRAARVALLGRGDRDEAGDAVWLRALAFVGAPLAIVLIGASGALFGVVGARPYWHTGLFPLLFIVAALASAAALLAGVAWLIGERERVIWLGRLLLVLLAIEVVVEWADVSVAYYSQSPAAWEAYRLVLTGDYWWVFWLVHLAAGLAIPVVLLTSRGRSPGWVAAAGGLVALTLVGFRLNVVVPGLAVPQIEGLDRAYVERGLDYSYFPSGMEWLVALFAVALVVGLVAAGLALLAKRGVRAVEPAAAAPGSTRAEFLGRAGIAGGALVASQIPLAARFLDKPGVALGATPYELARAENIVFSACQQCNTQCGIKAKIQDGVLVKIDGNPYSPWNMDPAIPYETPLRQAAGVDGWLCPKGQAGIQTLYDPYRIRKVLKRDGPRGSGKWKTITFEQAVSEIVDGGELFGSIGERRRVEGLKELWALRDPDAAEEMGEDVTAIWDGDLTVNQFKAKHARYLDTLIDPDHPDLGPKNNQVTFAWGRLKGGRSELLKRFISDSFGSTNAHGHTTVCQGSLYFAGKAMSEQFTDGKWQKGTKAYWQADLATAEFVIFVGCSPFEANYPPYRTRGITDGIASGRLKIAVVDPRLSKTAAKAWKWLPAAPGSEGALALALIRWVIENDRYDTGFLSNANKAAAAVAGESTWTNASWLIHADGEKKGEFLRASEIGLAEIEMRRDSEDQEYEFDYFVVLGQNGPVAVDPEDEEHAVTGKLLVHQKVKGVPVKSAMQLLYESSAEHTLAEWAEITDVSEQDLVELAREFTSHGKHAAADIHRGVSQHTNGYYNVLAWYSLNALVGNYDWAGGMAKASTFDIVGDKDGEPIPGKPFVLKDLHPSKLKPFGISLIRHDSKYEKTTIFADYPAKRPWFPLASDVYQEIVPSIGDAYPYPIKALIFYMGTPVYSLPGGHTNIEILSDPEKLPLFVCSDITIGETSMYADYIFPDLTYLERWEFAGSHPTVTQKVQPIRQPVVAPLTETVTVFGEQQPLSFESMLLGFAEKLGLPGFGPNGLAEGRALSRGDDLYLLLAANVAAGDEEDPVEPASAEERELFLRSRRHLPKRVFDVDRWRNALGDEWFARTVTVLSRGGRFSGENYDGDRLKNPYGKQLNLYQEKSANAVNSMTGEHYAGLATYFPAPADALGRPVEDDGYPLRLITFREIMHTKSRTVADYWLLALLPENSLLLNTADAKRLGFSEGDWAKLVSATNERGVWPLGNGKERPMVAKIQTTEGMRPGVVAFSLGHGHWAYGATDVEIDGQLVEGDARRGKGLHGNAAMRLDPHLRNVTLADLAGGSAVFYDTSVRLERASADGDKLTV